MSVLFFVVYYYLQKKKHESSKLQDPGFALYANRERIIYVLLSKKYREQSAR